jgi:hypothetical protein
MVKSRMSEVFEKVKGRKFLHRALHPYNELGVVYRKRCESKSEFWRFLYIQNRELGLYIFERSILKIR